MDPMRTPLLIAFSFTVLTAPSATAAEGTRLLGAGAAQMGTAGAGVASPQDSNWIALNPAGLVQVHAEVRRAVDARAVRGL